MTSSEPCAWLGRSVTSASAGRTASTRHRIADPCTGRAGWRALQFWPGSQRRPSGRFRGGCPRHRLLPELSRGHRCGRPGRCWRGRQRKLDECRRRWSRHHRPVRSRATSLLVLIKRSNCYCRAPLSRRIKSFAKSATTASWSLSATAVSSRATLWRSRSIVATTSNAHSRTSRSGWRSCP